MQLTCPKCHHVNPAATGRTDEPCPSCGVIYAKAIASAVRSVGAPGDTAPGRPRRGPGKATRAEGNFIDELRADSAYPAFRTVVSVATVLGYLVAACMALGAVIAAWPMEKPGLLAVGLLMAAVIFVITRVFKEMWFMLADMSDATIRMARQQADLSGG